MITEEEKEIIRRCAEKYNVATLYLFGSSIEKGDKAQDIDLGVKGLDARVFFKFYAELFKLLPKPVDLVDLNRSSLFNTLIEKTGVKLYG